MGACLLGHVRGPVLRPAGAPRGARPAARRGGVAARHLIFLGALAALLLQASPADADTLDRHAYTARLNEVASAIRSARVASGPARQPHVDRARALLRETTALRLEDGTTVPIDDRGLATRVDPTDASLDAAILDVTALREIATRPSTIDAQAADARLRQLVGEHRVQAGQVSIVEGLARWLTRLLSGLGGSAPDPRIVLTAAGGVGLAILVLVLAILGRGLRERVRREAVLPELAAERGADPAQHLRDADEAIRAGRPHEAIRALYLFAIATLAAREAIRSDPSLTDRELLAQARAIPHVDALRELVDLHERVSYGLRDAHAPDAERARALALRAVA